MSPVPFFGEAQNHIWRVLDMTICWLRRPYWSILAAGFLRDVGSVVPRGRLGRQLHGAWYAPGSRCSSKAIHQLCHAAPRRG